MLYLIKRNEKYVSVNLNCFTCIFKSHVFVLPAQNLKVIFTGNINISRNRITIDQTEGTSTLISTACQIVSNQHMHGKGAGIYTNLILYSKRLLITLQF